MRTQQDRMRRDMLDNTLFEKAHNYGKEYIEQVFDRHMYPKREDLEKLKIFDEDMPAEGLGAGDVIDLLQTYGAPTTMAQLGGRYYGFVNGSATPAGLAAKLLGTYWDQNAAMQATSPIAAKLEMVVEKWFKQIFNLPEDTAAGFVSGTSMATFCGLAAARYRILQRRGWDINEKGLYGAPKIRVIAGRQTHSTAIKASSLMGFGKEHIEWVDIDDQGRVIPEALPELDDMSIVMLQAGNVNSGSFDDFEAICKKANEAKAWVHVDGAFGLWAAASERLAYLTKGVEKANSWSVDGHKTLNTPYDCGVILCEDKEALVSALHMTGSYIVVSEERDGMFYTPEMSRRARIIDLWATMKYLGLAGIDAMIWGMHERAVQFGKVLGEAGFEVVNDVVFNQVMVACGDDELTQKTMELVQEDRVCWAGGSQWEGKAVIRISVSSWATTEEDVALSCASFVRSLEKAREALGR